MFGKRGCTTINLRQLLSTPDPLQQHIRKTWDQGVRFRFLLFATFSLSFFFLFSSNLWLAISLLTLALVMPAHMVVVLFRRRYWLERLTFDWKETIERLVLTDLNRLLSWKEGKKTLASPPPRAPLRLHYRRKYIESLMKLTMIRRKRTRVSSRLAAQSSPTTPSRCSPSSGRERGYLSRKKCSKSKPEKNRPQDMNHHSLFHYEIIFQDQSETTSRTESHFGTTSPSWSKLYSPNPNSNFVVPGGKPFHSTRQHPQVLIHGCCTCHYS